MCKYSKKGPGLFVNQWSHVDLGEYEEFRYVRELVHGNSDDDDNDEEAGAKFSEGQKKRGPKTLFVSTRVISRKKVRPDKACLRRPQVSEQETK